MGFVEDTATALVDALGFTAGLTANTTAAVTANAFPDSPNTLVAVIENPGRAPTFAFNSTSPLWRNPGAEVVSRSTSSASARSNAETAFTRLVGVANRTLPGASSGSTYLDVQALADVQQLGRDDAGRMVFAFDVVASKR